MSRHGYRLVIVVAVVALALVGCGDDDQTDLDLPDNDAVTEPDDVSDADADQDEAQDTADEPEADDPTDDPASDDAPHDDDVLVELAGPTPASLRGGACYVDEGVLHVTAGFATGIGPDRPQDEPLAMGTVTIVAPAMDGTHGPGEASVTLDDAGSELAEDSPSVTVEPGLMTGSFDGDEVSGTWSCPGVLTVEQLNDLRDYLDG